MKALVLAATLIASLMAVAATAQADPSSFNGAQFWEEHNSRGHGL